MKVLLGITGSVATTLTPKLVNKLKANGHEVKIVATDMAFQFVDYVETQVLVEDYIYLNTVLPPERNREPNREQRLFVDNDEFYGRQLKSALDDNQTNKHYSLYRKDDSVAHIELRDWADVFLVCPITANTMAKFANGVCDNLLTSVFRAWDFSKPVYVAPAMNTKMWLHPATRSHLRTFKEWNVKVIYPTVKKLACGENGVGGLADLDTIVNLMEGYSWRNPFRGCVIKEYYGRTHYLPLSPHPGAFGTNRHFHVHTGVDLYANVGTYIYPVEDGEIVSMGQFTGEKAGSPWWHDTWYVSIKGKSGIIVYGEIAFLEVNTLEVGQKIKSDRTFGKVLEVVKEPPKKFVEGHQTSMLHLELLKGDVVECPDWKIGEEKPKEILDPTPYLYI